MLVNDIKKGTWGVLKYTNWEFQVMDNKKGITRVLDVYGWAHEMGSTYVWDIEAVYPLSQDMTHEEFMECVDQLAPEPLELSPKQGKQAQLIQSYGF